MLVVQNLFALLLYVVNLYKWAIILAALVSMLASFGVLDTRNRLVWTVADFLTRITEPALRPIRRFVPPIGGIDLSPWIAVLLISFIVVPVIISIEQGLVYNDWRGPMPF